MTALARIDLPSLRFDAESDQQARLVLADLHEERGDIDVATLLRDPTVGEYVAAGLDRPECMRLWLDEVPERSSKLRKRVDKLTAKETAAVPGWVDQWVKIGLSTTPADRPLFAAAVTACYRYAGLKAPRIAWCPSPIVAVMAGSVWHSLGHDLVDSQVRSQVASQVRSQVYSQVRSQVYSQVDSQVRSQVYSQVRSQVYSQVDSQVASQVYSQVRSQVGSQVYSQVRSQVYSQVDSQVYSNQHDLPPEWIEAIRSNWTAYFGGQFWVGDYWLGSPSAASYCLDVLRLDIGRDVELRARAYAATASAACWWYPLSDVVFVSERPSQLELDAKGKLIVASWDGWEVRP